MRKCGKCQQPMISAGSLCGRCQPPVSAFVKQAKGTQGSSRNLTYVDMSVFEQDRDAGPSSKAFYFWAVKPSSWPILAVGVQLIEQIKKTTYRAPSAKVENETNPESRYCRLNNPNSASYQDRDYEAKRGLSSKNNSRPYWRQEWGVQHAAVQL